MKQYPYVITDMDGTFLDSMQYWRNLGAEYLYEHDRALFSDGELASFLGRGARDIFRCILRERGLCYERQEVWEEMYRRMERHYREDVKPIPETVDYLTRLAEGGARIALVTATRHSSLHLGLRVAGLPRELFSAILTDEDNGGVGKSDPGIFRMAMERLGCDDPSRCLVLEDALYSIRTARGIGMPVVALLDPVSRSDWEEIRRLSEGIITPARRMERPSHLPFCRG